jgi:hypothetical protein
MVRSESNWVAFEGEIYLALTLIIISSNNSVFALLNSWDEEVFTPCTVLCVSNTIGVVFVLAYYKFIDCTLTMSEVEKVSASDWAWLTVGTLLYSVVGPLLLFLGVAKLGVPTVTILQRLESVNVCGPVCTPQPSWHSSFTPTLTSIHTSTSPTLTHSLTHTHTHNDRC